MKYVKLLLCIVLSLCLQGCPGEPDEATDGSFTIKNTSNEIMYVYYVTSTSEILPNYFAVQPSLIINIAGSWNETFGDSYFEKNKKLWVLIFKKSTVENHTWQEIKDQGIYDKRYELTFDKLKSMNYEIIYDGN
ncbi:hypothetical protein [Flavobacterium sp.]|uniref:hypothetical protein n=1 Tax=Flavobacterium sp. TaxID=239 RepID=UPI003D1103D9